MLRSSSRNMTHHFYTSNTSPDNVLNDEMRREGWFSLVTCIILCSIAHIQDKVRTFLKFTFPLSSWVLFAVFIKDLFLLHHRVFFSVFTFFFWVVNSTEDLLECGDMGVQLRRMGRAAYLTGLGRLVLIQHQSWNCIGSGLWHYYDGLFPCWTLRIHLNLKITIYLPKEDCSIIYQTFYLACLYRIHFLLFCTHISTVLVHLLVF